MPSNRLQIRHFESAEHLPAASRASWIGTLQLDELSVPVKAFSTIASPESHLHLIHAGCGRRVSVPKVCPQHGTLESNEIRKAYAYSADSLVELSDVELEQLYPPDDKKIVLDRFLSSDRLDPTLLAGRTLFLAPASLVAQPAFHLLKAAFDHKKTWALGRTVLSQKRQLIVIHARDESLLLHTLHDPAQRRMPVNCQPNGPSPSRREVQSLAKAMEDRDDPIPWADYCDDFHEQLATLVSAKVDAKNRGRKRKTKTTRSPKAKTRSRGRTVAKAA